MYYTKFTMFITDLNENEKFDKPTQFIETTSTRLCFQYFI